MRINKDAKGSTATRLLPPVIRGGFEIFFFFRFFNYFINLKI
jgi:hypothetical protein